MPDQTQQPTCRWCGNSHSLICPFVKALEFDADRPEVVVRVEFVTSADFPSPKPVVEPPQYPRLKDSST